MAKKHSFQGPVEFNKFEAYNMRLQNLFILPPEPFEGQVIYKSDIKVGAYYDGTDWIFFGKHNLLPDLQGGKPAVDTEPAEMYHSDKNQHDAIEAANNPSADNPFATMEDVEEATFTGKHSDLDLDDGPNPHGTKHSDLTLDDGTNPHGTTKADVGLGNADNTADINKPVSGPQQAALDLKADKEDLPIPDLVLDYSWDFDGNKTLAIPPPPPEYGENWYLWDVLDVYMAGFGRMPDLLISYYPDPEAKTLTIKEDWTPKIDSKIIAKLKFIQIQ